MKGTKQKYCATLFPLWPLKRTVGYSNVKQQDTCKSSKTEVDAGNTRCINDTIINNNNNGTTITRTISANTITATNNRSNNNTNN